MSHLHPKTTTSQATTEESTEGKTTTFLSLPPEIRNHIYQLAGEIEPLPCAAAETLGVDCPPAPIWVCISLPTTTSTNLDQQLNQSSTCARREVERCSSLSEHRIGPTHSAGATVGMQQHKLFCKQRGLRCLTQQPALTKVCRALRRETLSMFYGTNTFVFTWFDMAGNADWEHDVLSFKRWLAAIGPINAGMLRSIKVVCRHVWAIDETGRRMRRSEWVRERFVPEMVSFGVRDGVVTSTMLSVGFQKFFCECCIGRSLT
jgi:hypothetical protein